MDEAKLSALLNAYFDLVNANILATQALLDLQINRTKIAIGEMEQQGKIDRAALLGLEREMIVKANDDLKTAVQKAGETATVMWPPRH